MKTIFTIILVCLTIGLFAQRKPNTFPEKSTAEGTDAIYTQETGQARKILFESARMFFIPDIDLVPLDYDIDSSGTNIVDSLRGRFVIDQSGDWFYVDKDKTAVAIGSGGSGSAQSLVIDSIGRVFTLTLSGGGGTINFEDTNTQLDESQVDAFVANNGYLDNEVDGSTVNELSTVSLITHVSDTTILTPKQGDVFINNTADTLGFYHSYWKLFYGGGGGSTTITFTADAGPAQARTDGDFLDIEGDPGTGSATVASPGKIEIRNDTTILATRAWAASQGGGGGLKYYAEGDMSSSDITGNTRGPLSFDFQQGRDHSYQIIDGVRNVGFGYGNWIDERTMEAVVYGKLNVIKYDSVQQEISDQSFLTGIGGLGLGWRGTGGGNRYILDGKIATAFGNGPYAGGNDSFARGNRSSTGAIRCVVIETGKDTNHGIAGNTDPLPYVVLQDSLAPFIIYGDLRGYFPCAYTYEKTATLSELQDTIDAIYGVHGITAGSYSMNSTGYVYSIAAGFDGTQITWAMAPYFWLKDGVSETGHFRVQCANTFYEPGVGTKIYYFEPDEYTELALNLATSVYSSYSPVILNMGNGQDAGGRLTSTTGHGAASVGELNESWGPGTFTYGLQNRSWAPGGAAGGFGSIVTRNGFYGFAFAFQGVTNANYAGTINYKNQSHGAASFSTGWETITRGIAAQTGGYRTQGDGNYSVTNGYESKSPGLGAFTDGFQSEGEGSYSRTGGYGGQSVRNAEYSWGGYAPTMSNGDIQYHRYHTGDITSAAGFYFKPIISRLDSNTVYSGTVDINAVQTGGINGEVGESASYIGKFTFTTKGQYTYGPSTVDISTDYIDIPNPPAVGDRVIFTSAFGGVLNTTRYHVVTSDVNGIQISGNAGGAALNITAVPSSEGTMTVVVYNENSASIDQVTFDFFDDGDDVSTMNLQFESNNAFWADSSGSYFRLKQTSLNNREIRWSYFMRWKQIRF